MHKQPVARIRRVEAEWSLTDPLRVMIKVQCLFKMGGRVYLWRLDFTGPSTAVGDSLTTLLLRQM